MLPAAPAAGWARDRFAADAGPVVPAARGGAAAAAVSAVPAAVCALRWRSRLPRCEADDDRSSAVLALPAPG
ncbi:hypothetical protein CEQ24_001795 [Burkholderia glumae]|nr:hypothetical protein CEQ24_001795 [Burkholderia glumae]